MNGKADIPSKTGPRDWLWLGNDPSKIVSSWMLLEAFYLRLREYFEPNEALQRLTALSMPIKKRYLFSGKERIISSVEEEIGLSVGTNTITSADFLEIRDREYFHPSESEPVEFLVPTANAERELERLRSG